MRLLFLSCWLFAIFATLALRSPAVAQEAEVDQGSDQSAQSEADPEKETPAETPAETQKQPPEEEPEEDPDEQPESVKPPAKFWEAEGESASSGPDIFLLPDANRNLRQVLGFRYEDFLRLWQQKDGGEKTTPPKFLLDSIRVSGRADNSHVDLRFEIDIHSRVINDWIAIPLEMPSLMVQGWEIDRQTEEEFLVFDAKRESYVLWLKSESSEPRTLKLHGLSKLKPAPTNPGFELKLPHATTSEFVLQVPIADAQFEASPGIDIKTVAGKDGSTEVQLSGQARPLRLQWKAAETEERSGNTAIKAEGQLKVQIDRRRASYEVELSIDSYGDPLERLRIRLPVGAKLTGENLSGEYRIVEQTLDPERGDIVEIELPESNSKKWTLRFAAEQLRDRDASTNKANATYRITGFEVLNALRQSGTLALHVDEQLQAYFDLSGDIEQVPEQENSPPVQSSTHFSSFAYSRFPWAVEAHTLERQSRVSVKPRYEMQLEPQYKMKLGPKYTTQLKPKYALQLKQSEAVLQVTFEYEFAGAKTFAVRIDMRGWELGDNPIESDGAVDLERIFEEPRGLLVLPLVDPNVERLRLSMTVRRGVPLGHRSIPLPTAEEAFVLPGNLSVAADPALQVTPTIVATEGVSVVTDQDTHLAGKSDVGRDVLYLRTFLPRATLSAEIKLRERQVAVEVETRVDVDQQTVHVLQQLKYEVKYRPTSLLLLRIPEPLWNNESLKVQLDGKDLQFNLGIFSEKLPSDEEDASKSPAVAVRQLRVSLPRPRQNNFQLDLTYEVPSPDLATEAISPLVLPLLSPDDPVGDNVVGIYTAKPIRATLNQTAGKGPWSARTESEPSETNATLLRTTLLQMKGSGKPATIPLFLQIESKEDIELPTLEKAWLQTWIVGERQQIRAVFLFRASQPTVFAQLPPGMRNTNIEVLLDGSPSEFESLSNSRVAVSVPPMNRRARHTLELRYQLEARLAGWGILHVSLPRLECRSNIGHVFWQLVLPRGWHVANAPQQLAAEYQVGWSHSRWGRHPTHDQPELEDLTGAFNAPKPPASANQYLYSGFEIPHEVDVLVVSHLWLMITCILSAFGMGMLFMTTSIAKHISFWLLLALALTAGAFSYPEFTLLATQAVFWGGAMLLVTNLLQKTFAGPSRSGYVLAPQPLSASTAVTESWLHGQPVLALDEETETTSIQAGGPVL